MDTRTVQSTSLIITHDGNGYCVGVHHTLSAGPSRVLIDRYERLSRREARDLVETLVDVVPWPADQVIAADNGQGYIMQPSLFD